MTVRRALALLGALVVVAAAVAVWRLGGEDARPAGDDAGGPAGSGPAGDGGSGAGSPGRSPRAGFGEVGLLVEGDDGSLLVGCLLAAATAEQRQRGLMEVTDLGGYDGMAFLYDQDVTNGFYMRNTPMPLSIAWISADGALVDAADMAPCGDREGCPTYLPSGAYRFAVEVPQGDLDDLGLVEGSRITVGGACRTG